MSNLEPYVGPRSFRSDEAEIFFGRFEEADRLTSLVIANRVVLLYAQSGAGKTSLINAGLLPTLYTEENFRSIGDVRVTGPADRADIQSDGDLTSFEINAAQRIAEATDQPLASDTHWPSLHDVLTPLGLDNPDTPMLLVFDQFEELFTTRTAEPSDRERFLDRLVKTVDTYPDLRILLSTREEWLADIEERSSRFRDHLRARMRLHGLRPEQARSAIREPVRAVGEEVTFESSAADKLVRDLATETVEGSDGRIRRLSGDYIEPVQLQVVCSALWQRRDRARSEITHADLEAVGSVDQALADYYDECIAQAAEDRYEDELFLRNWFEHQLITASGTRGLVHAGPMGAAGVPNDVVARLQALHILKLERRSGSRWVELSHDRLMEPIKQANARWRELRGADVAQRSVSTLERIRKIGTVRLGVTMTPPFCFEDANGVLTGESIVVPRELFKDLGVFRVEPVFCEFAKLGTGLDSGRFDVASSGIFITTERSQNHLFSLPTLTCGFGFLVPAGNPRQLHSLEDVRDDPEAVLAVSNRTVEHDIALEIGIPPERIVTFVRGWMALDALRTGQVDAFVMVELDIPYFLHRASGAVEAAEPFSDPIVGDQPYRGEAGLMMRKSDTDLAEAVNDALRRFVGTARHAELVAPFGITREMLPDV